MCFVGVLDVEHQRLRVKALKFHIQDTPTTQWRR